MRKIVMFVLSFCLLGTAFAQINPEESRKHIILKVMPLGMFDVDNTFQLGAEIPFPDNRFTVQQEAGYGHSSFNIWYNDADSGGRPDKNTIKTRTQLRFYFYQKRFARSYVAGEYLFKRVVNKETRWVGTDCATTGGCSFFEYKEVRFGRFVNALHVKAGWQFYFANRMTMDLYTGLGLRKPTYRTLTPNAENLSPRDNWLWWSGDWADGGEVIPSLAFGFSIGVTLGKFNK
ncbi:hypothetical protein DYBT9275_01642 [Dyadobacter sp. CECT 9275]|uniref:DUF3575 domain-containing protein n=1 Tax=Dyadobacter helix TaxID=2822344 RepID=A0A916JAP9_9BACT|nr:DUF3575 domain-containing protein [Dyadobacter sp. CECT 9275]CAG4995455.1 hypothetical protein DYBT9275_01642 [Dyadobacter sp. CECT 9275]